MCILEDKKLLLYHNINLNENRMEKTRDLFKKIGAIKEIFHARMGMIKDRNGKDLTSRGD